ncbi:MAG: thioredoxin family protein [Chlamydiae bacterium]|nr:thioredoxin family protein [Chlamydiota bacterium]
MALVLQFLFATIVFFVSPAKSQALESAPSFFYSVDSEHALDLLKNKAEKENKFLIVMFLGSQWCPWSQKMEREVFSDESFQSFLIDTCIFAKVEIPSTCAFDSNLKNLMSSLDVKESPTFLLLSPFGEIIKKEGFLSCDGKGLAIYWKEGLDAFNNLISSLDTIKDVKDEKDLENLYQIATYHGFNNIKNKIIDVGLKICKSPFFYLEKYEALSKHRKFKHPEMISLRKKIIQMDPKNKRLSQLRLAIVDFTNMQNRKKTKNSIEVVSPLVQYIKNFGSSDCENLWKIELMVAQYFLSRGEYKMAKDFAVQSKQHAPDVLKDELVSTIDYIDSVLVK